MFALFEPPILITFESNRGNNRMRITRLGALLVALFTTLALTLSLAPGSASAAPSPAAAAAAKPKHDFAKLNAGDTAKKGRYFVKGQVVTYRKRPVTLQKKVKNGGAWRNVKTQKSNKWGGFKMTFGGKVGNRFRVKLNGTPWRAKTIRNIGRIVPARTVAGSSVLR